MEAITGEKKVQRQFWRRWQEQQPYELDMRLTMLFGDPYDGFQIVMDGFSM